MAEEFTVLQYVMAYAAALLVTVILGVGVAVFFNFFDKKEKR
jgi:ABC-type phosphate transport system permease subunit